MKTKYSIFLIFLLFLNSCKKNAAKEFPELIGTWSNKTTTIIINEDGTASYDYSLISNDFTENKYVNGKAKIKNNFLYISGIIKTRKLYINQYPTKVEVDFSVFNTYIVLDNDTLYKDPINTSGIDFMCSNGRKDGDETNIDCGGDCTPCPSCDDGIKNQDETGIDCGGQCGQCQKGSCNDSLQLNTAYLKHCSGNLQPNIYNFSYTGFHQSQSDNRFEIYSSSGYWWSIYVAFTSPPVASFVYDLKADYYGINSNDYSFNKASILYIYSPIGANPYYFMHDGGKLYVTVEDSIVTAVFCNLEFQQSSLFGCMNSSGKLSWKIK